MREQARFSGRSSRAICSRGIEHMKILQPPNWPRPKGYSNGISARGRMIFTAGIIGWDENECFADDTLHGQFARTLMNTLEILAQDGAGPQHVVRMTIYVIDRAEYLGSRDEMGAAWREIMGPNYPAMALVEVKNLVESAARIAIETTAAAPGFCSVPSSRERFLKRPTFRKFSLPLHSSIFPNRLNSRLTPFTA